MVVTQRFFDIHMFARLTGPNRSQHVPMIARGNYDRINIFIIQELS